MKKFFKTALLGIMSCLPATSHAIAINGSISVNKKTGNVLVFLGDLHFDKKEHQATDLQKEQCLKIAHLLGAHVVIEDMSTIPCQTLRDFGMSEEKINQIQSLYSAKKIKTMPCAVPDTYIRLQDADSMDTIIDQPWQPAHIHSPLTSLEKLCRERGISVYNAEFRHAYFLSSRGYGLSVQDVTNINKEIINSCAHLQNVGPKTQELYASTLERYNNKKAKKIFDTMLKKNPSLTIAEIAQQTGIDPDIYDWELLNLIMLSQIAHNQHNKVTIVYAGGDHTDCIKPLLPELGYELITDLGSDEVMDTNYEDQRGTIPVLNLEQIPTILAEKGLFNAHAIANDYLIPLYRTVTTGQFPLGSFV